MNAVWSDNNMDAVRVVTNMVASRKDDIDLQKKHPILQQEGGRDASTRVLCTQCSPILTLKSRAMEAAMPTPTRTPDSKHTMERDDVLDTTLAARPRVGQHRDAERRGQFDRDKNCCRCYLLDVKCWSQSY